MLEGIQRYEFRNVGKYINTDIFSKQWEFTWIIDHNLYAIDKSWGGILNLKVFIYFS